MKKKYYTPLSILIIILALLGTGVYGSLSIREAKSQIHFKSLGPLPEISAPVSKDILRINKLIQEMPKLSSPPQTRRASAGADLSLFSNFNQRLKNGGMETDSDEIGYSLSFAFSAENKKFCVINGKFYSEGNSLPDGALINMIEAERVLISKNKLQKWLLVTGPIKTDRGK